MRGLNDFNLKLLKEKKKMSIVSVPMRGLNDFNKRKDNHAMTLECFRPHAGFK